MEQRSRAVERRGMELGWSRGGKQRRSGNGVKVEQRRREEEERGRELRWNRGGGQRRSGVKVEHKNAAEQ